MRCPEYPGYTDPEYHLSQVDLRLDIPETAYFGAKLSDYDYDLPTSSIALYPTAERDRSRLMVLHRQEQRIEHRVFRDLPEFLAARDCLVINETKVFPARLRGVRVKSGGSVELLLLRRKGDLWEALARPARRLKVGAEVKLLDGSLTAVVEAVCPSGRRLFRFDGEDTLEEMLARIGEVPLPPYIHREVESNDRERYQTVYARRTGAVAAPTAGLHFTDGLLAQIGEAGVAVAPIVLHVGPGTFLPVEEENPEDHEMEAESFEVSSESAERINLCRRKGGRVVVVGTTSVRTLESVVEKEGEDWVARPDSGWTKLFIRPPYPFVMVDALITNFHLPRSTLLMLVSAFAGRQFVMEAYAQAIREGYRFYSYGDAMLIL